MPVFKGLSSYIFGKGLAFLTYSLKVFALSYLHTLYLAFEADAGSRGCDTHLPVPK